ncbi:MAG: hypothetical protein LC734_07145, partial [Acidobacteria bacterium]|nr:hypothetical protein [Acidobacteriota bacterium]
MKRFTAIAVTLLTILAANAFGQAAGSACRLQGEYVVEPGESDELYTIAREAALSVPKRDRRQFFNDLALRLTPPESIGIECRGRQVSIGSSRAEKVTFVADGQSRRERSSSGGFVTSRISLANDTLTFASSRRAVDTINVQFQSIDDGRQLLVVRRIFAEQLDQPVEIRTRYNRISDSVDWTAYGAVPARLPNRNPGRRTPTGISRGADELRAALDAWIRATNRQDIEAQMEFYSPRLDAFYLARNVTQNVARLEKQRAFSAVRSVELQAEEPEIVFLENGRFAVMRFRKTYRVVGQR